MNIISIMKKTAEEIQNKEDETINLTKAIILRKNQDIIKKD